MATLPPIASLTLADAPRWQPVPKAEPSPSERARRDAMKAIARDIPDPKKYAWYLPNPYCFWLMDAWRSQDPANSGCLRVADDRAGQMFPMGLCDRDGYLTVFGMRVRHALLEQPS